MPLPSNELPFQIYLHVIGVGISKFARLQNHESDIDGHGDAL